LYYYGARWYDAALGRFVQADTVVPSMSNPQAWDRYAYVNNNPVLNVDPTGHVLDQGGGASSMGDDWWKNRQTTTKKTQTHNDPLLDPEYSNWRNLVRGSPCTACHVTHDTGRIPTNDELDPDLIQYYRSLDKVALDIHLAALSGVSNMSSLAPPLNEFEAAHLNGPRITGEFPESSNSQYLFREPSTSDTAGFASYDSDGNVVFRVDLQGSSHGDVSTPHLHTANWNTNPAAGQTFFNGWSKSVSAYDPVSIIFYLLGY
jgi:hypothetical protein